jgi:hypothetical protein
MSRAVAPVFRSVIALLMPYERRAKRTLVLDGKREGTARVDIVVGGREGW